MQLACADKHLSRKAICLRPCQSVFDTGISQCFDKHCRVSGRTAAYGTRHGKMGSVDRLNQRNFFKQVFDHLKFFSGQRMLVLADDNSFCYRHRRIGTGAQVMCPRKKRLLQFFKRIACRHRHNDLIFQLFPDGRCHFLDHVRLYRQNDQIRAVRHFFGVPARMHSPFFCIAAKLFPVSGACIDLFRL